MKLPFAGFLGLVGCLFLISFMTGCAPASSQASLHDGSAFVGKVCKVRTTAFRGHRNALSGPLQYGKVTSAASDWSRFPLGTRFKILETGRRYVIDDYGSAMIDTHTIDLYMPSDRLMHAWGARRVHVFIEEWGSARKSLEVLAPRKHAWYVQRMLASLRAQTQGLPKEFYRVIVTPPPELLLKHKLQLAGDELANGGQQGSPSRSSLAPAR